MSRRNLILIIITVLVIVSFLFLKTTLTAHVQEKKLSTDHATLSYDLGKFATNTQLSLDVGVPDSHVPEDYEPYKDYFIKAFQENKTPDTSLDMTLTINYSDIDLEACEISAQDFKVFQSDPNAKITELPTTVNTNEKTVTATIKKLPQIESLNPSGTKTYERWSYFALGNKHNRFIDGACGKNAKIYLNNGKIYQRPGSYGLSYDATDDIYQARVEGFDNVGMTMPFNLEKSKYILTVDAYTSIIPFSLIEGLSYSDGILPLKQVIVKDGEKVINRTNGSTPNTIILELEGINENSIRAVRQSPYKTKDNQDLVYSLNVSFPPDTSAPIQNKIKDKLQKLVTTLEMSKPEF